MMNDGINQRRQRFQRASAALNQLQAARFWLLIPTDCVDVLSFPSTTADEGASIVMKASKDYDYRGGMTHRGAENGQGSGKRMVKGRKRDNVEEKRGRRRRERQIDKEANAREE